MIKISELRSRDVVNVLDGKRLGNIIDIDLDLNNGRIVAIVLPGRQKGFGFFSKREDITVPWDKIVRIGHDVILVEAANAQDSSEYRRTFFLDDEH